MESESGKVNNITVSQDDPLWWKLLNLDASHFERSKYAAPLSPESKGKFRLKNLEVLRKLAPDLYEAGAQEVKEYNTYLAEHDGGLKKYKLGRKLGSIHALDAALHPELMNDPKAREKYWLEHPEMKAHGSTRK